MSRVVAAARAAAADAAGVLECWARQPSGSDDHRGLTAMRAAIAEHYGRWYGVDVPASSVAVTTGSSGGFMLAFLAAFRLGHPEHGVSRRSGRGHGSGGGGGDAQGSGAQAQGAPQAGLSRGVGHGPLLGVIFGGGYGMAGARVKHRREKRSELRGPLLSWPRSHKRPRGRAGPFGPAH